MHQRSRVNKAGPPSFSILIYVTGNEKVPPEGFIKCFIGAFVGSAG
jgi:hypothetical protein